MKYCWKCQTTLAKKFFGKNKSTKDGLMPVCKGCNLIRVREWQSANPDKVKHTPEKQIRRHGITTGEHKLLFDKFLGLCHACKEAPATVIDHNHDCCPGTYSCGKCVRGLLCSNCNTALGLLKDSGKRIIDLLDYTIRSL